MVTDGISNSLEDAMKLLDQGPEAIAPLPKEKADPPKAEEKKKGW